MLFHTTSHPRKDGRWYGTTSRCYPCPFPSTAKTTPILAGTGTVLHRRKYETEKYANMSYESNLIIKKNHVQGWEYFILVSKLQWEPGNYLYAFYDRNIVQTIQRSLFLLGRGTLIYWNKNRTNLLTRDKMNVGVVLNCYQFPKIILRGEITMHIQI